MVDTRSKTLPAYIDDMGNTRTITRRRRMWWVNSGHGFSHMDMVKAWIEAEGYTFTRVPNSNYRGRYGRLSEFDRLVGMFS
jgi:hypothetical protein